MSKDKSNEMTIYFPYKPDSDSYVIPKKMEDNGKCEQGLPIPPQNLWLGYGKESSEYLGWAKHQVTNMIGIVEASGFDFGGKKRILELGCGAGRMLRWFKQYTDKSEVWGTDISSEHIYWANKYLKPPFNFATTTTIPHLPFEDRYFDFIYAGSVFTHIDDLADSWLLELKRILTDTGRIFITIHDQHSIDLLNTVPVWKDSWLSKYINENPLFLENQKNYDVFVGLRGPESQVFYDIDYFKKSISNIFEVASITPEAYGFQTGVLLKKKL